MNVKTTLKAIREVTTTATTTICIAVVLVLLVTIAVQSMNSATAAKQPTTILALLY